MFNNIGVSGLVIILIIALIVFGPAKLPQLGRAFGDTLREFRNSTRGMVEDVTVEKKDDTKQIMEELR
ncbi:twin-arginine translocase TatA/TatE family subunit [Paenibacillus sp. RC67]|uniref:twin-arginine translocase TatA/TatE family subunit n=1 Tax=Paenibacillus sp. RC67 TaxID=3039392 RepID=UPI0024AE1C01|nr:twin-arginine translocase TatA/TatE family subunit [Paenibacillus sp. RC67]